MTGIKYDFDVNDIVIAPNGTIQKAIIDNQNVALIALCQVCRLNYPEVGAQIGARIIETHSVDSVLADAKEQAKRDGAKNSDIRIVDGQLSFSGTYED